MLPLSDEQPMDKADLQYATWGETGSQLVYVYRDNIYYKPTAETAAIRIATTTQESVVLNGIPDWLYEEEILGESNAIWFSPNGTRLCYASFNDSEVDEMSYPYYGPYDDPHNLYPGTYRIRYPKPGRVNPTVTLWVVDVGSSSPQPITHTVIPPPQITQS